MKTLLHIFLFIIAFFFMCGVSESNDEAIVMIAVAAFVGAGALVLKDANEREKEGQL